MSKIAVVYWSATGNTGAMANAIGEGIQSAGCEAEVCTVSEFDAASLSSYDKVAFGCPAMGAEVLEEDEFEPFFSSVESSLSGKTVALFGSYGWGDGQWMRDWQDRVTAAGATLYNGEGLIVNDAPDDGAIEECKAFGAGLAQS